MKKILLSLSSIAAVAAIVAVGSTGAWWTDTAESSENTFHSGSMDLHLSNTGNGGDWHQDVEKTWEYDNMYPGGDSMGDKLYLANGGSTPADWLKISATTDPTDENGNMDKHMRITKLAYAGESLLEDGAGANLNDYEGPAVEDCDVIVNGESGGGEYKYIQSAVDAASSNDLVCVRNGDYNEAVTIDTVGVTLASFNGADSVSIDGIIEINAEDVIVKGLSVLNGSDKAGGQNPVGVYVTEANATLKYSNIKGNRLSSGETGIMTTGNADNLVATNNVIENWWRAVYLNPSQDILLTENTIKDSDYGLSTDGQDNLSVLRNNFNEISEETMGASNVGSIKLNYNNIETDSPVVHYGGNAVNATKNWWGDYDPSDQVEGSVNTSNYLGGPHAGFVNGVDYNDNGFADLHDFYAVTDYDDNPIVVEDPDLETDRGNKKALNLQVQLDGPTADADDQNSEVGLDVTIEMGQGPANQ